jgi:YD repeat-containing protein
MDIRNNANQLLATTRNSGTQTGVYDSSGKNLGYMDSRGTFDAQGRQVSTSQVAGLLVK